MKSLVLLVSVLMIALGLLAQTGIPSPLCIHVGIIDRNEPKELLCMPIRVGQPIAFTNDDSCVLKGIVEQQGTNLIARHLEWWRIGNSYESGFTGTVRLEEPAFGGGVGEWPRTGWVIVSTNLDVGLGVEEVKTILQARRKEKSGP